MAIYPLKIDKVQYAYSGHYGGKRKEKIDRIIIHHAAAPGWTMQTLLDFMSSGKRQVSATFAIGNDGKIGLAVPEASRPWTTSGYHDEYAITVEVCNSKGAPNWEVSDAALNKLIELVAYTCSKYGLEPRFTGDKSGTIHYHGMYEATSCPGPYLKSKMKYIEQEAKKLIAGIEKPAPTPTPTPDELWRVQVGAYKDEKNALAMEKKLKDKGYDTYVVTVDGLIKVQTGAFAYKENADKLEAKLKKDGFETYITTKGGKKYEPKKPEIKVGSKVRVSKGAKTYTGGNLYEFVYATTYTVLELNKDRAVIGLNGEVTAAMNIEDLYLV